MQRQTRDWPLFLMAHSLFALLALAPLLLGTHLFIGIGLGHSYPFFSYQTFEHLLSGAVWMNQLNMNGFPSYLPFGSSTNPTTYLFTTLLPTFTDLHWFVFFHVVAGGVLCSMMLRRLDVSRTAAIVGSCCFMAGSWWLVVTPEFTPLMPILPLIVFVQWQSLKRPIHAAVWGSLLSGYIWLGVNAQVALMLFSAFGVGTLVLAWRERIKGWKAVLRPLIVMVVSMGVGTLIGISKVLPSLVYGELSWRAGGLDVAEAASGGLQPLTVVTYLFPYASFPFLNFGGELLQVFIGAFGFAFLLAGLWMACRKKASPVLRWWVAAYVLVIALAFQHSPLATLLHSIPPFSFFRGAGRWTMMSTFAAAPIVAFAFDALVQNRIEPIRKKLALLFGWLASLCAAGLIVGQLVLMGWTDEIIAFFQRYFAYFHKVLHLGPPLEYYQAFVDRRIHELVSEPLILEPRALFPFLSLIILALALRSSTWKLMQKKPMLLALLTLLTTALSLMWYNNYFPRKDFPKTVATVEFLKTHPGTALGIFSNGTAPILAPGHRFTAADDMQWTMEHLIPNTNLFSDIHVLDYFDNLASRRTSAMAAWVGAQWVPTPSKYNLARDGADITEQTKRLTASQDVLNLQGVRYLVSSFPLPKPFTNVFETKITSANLPVMIYENPNARPFIYIASSIVTMKEDEDAALESVLKKRWPELRSLIECEPNCNSHSNTGEGAVGKIERSPTNIRFVVRNDGPQWLIVTLNRLPGWHVFVDGIETQSFYANGAYFGIPVSDGHHDVELKFSILDLL